MNVCADKDVTSDHDDGSQRFGELRAFHSTTEEIAFDDVPLRTARIRALLASGESFEAVHGDRWTLSNLRSGTYAVQAIDESGRLLAESITTIEHIRASGRSMDLRRLSRSTTSLRF